MEIKQRDFFGVGSINLLNKLLRKNKVRRIFLVTGKKSYKASRAKELLSKILNPYDTIQFSDFNLNPSIKDIIKGINIFKKQDFDIVIAVGGGSVIDIAKTINILAAQTNDAIDYIKGVKKINRKGKELIAIPTTSGSGSEATHFAVIYIDKTKYSLTDSKVLPTYAIVDPQLTFDLPPSITASCGMDAFCQAVESYWSINSTAQSKKYAKEAIPLILNNLSIAVNNPTKEARIAMSKAAHLAGKSIDIAQTTACHAISYPMTSYLGIPHGHAVALTLGPILEYNEKVTIKDINDKRGVTFVKTAITELNKLLKVPTAKEGHKFINDLLKKIHLQTKLSELNLTRNDLEIIIKNGFNLTRVKNNPRVLTKGNLRTVLNSIY